MYSNIYLYSDSKTISILKKNCPKVILIGSYLGYSNFGDILQLKGALKYHRDNTRLEPIVVCDLKSITDKDFINRVREWFRVEAVIFVDKRLYNLDSIDFQLIDEVPPVDFLHLYGGGFLNKLWGNYMINLIEGLLKIFNVKNYVVSGQQLDSSFISELESHFNKYPPCIVGGRDYKSVEIIQKLGVKGGFSFDDAFDILKQWTLSVSKETQARKNNLLIHINTSSYTNNQVNKKKNEIVIKHIHTLSSKFPDSEPIVLQAYNDQRYNVKDSLSSIVEMEEKFPFTTYSIVNIANLALQYKPDDDLPDPNLLMINGKCAIASSYHTTLFLNLLGVPCYLVSLNDYYNQKRLGLEACDSLENFLNNPYIPSYEEKSKSRQNWLSELTIHFTRKEIRDESRMMIKLNSSNSIRSFNFKDDGISNLIEDAISWQKEQTDKWWRKAEELKRDLEWQKEQTDKWWRKAEELKEELNKTNNKNTKK